MPAKGTGRGWCLHAKGYPMVTTRGPNRNKLVHRVVMAAICREWCYYPLGPDGLPPGFDVHHLDFNKLNFCYCNLLLIQTELHAATNQAQGNAVRWGNGHRNFEEVD
jgi:hypothetical protein